MRQLEIAFFLSVFVTAHAGIAKDMAKASATPLTPVVVNTRSVFLSNGGGSDLAYDAFCSEMKRWGKYEIVGSPEEAGLILELTYRAEEHDIFAGSATGTNNDVVGAHSIEIVDPQVVLTVYDAKSRTPLWSEIDHRRLARTEKNREKETINSVQRLVDSLKARIIISQ